MLRPEASRPDGDLVRPGDLALDLCAQVAGVAAKGSTRSKGRFAASGGDAEADEK